MRLLTVRRNKSYIGCLMKAKVYIEDPVNGELFINDTPCRKLGTLKSGEEKTFEVSEAPAKVFVIADKLSKNYCNDFYQLDYGTEPVFLSGRNKYNPATGNAFRFDNNENNVEVLKNRRRGLHKGLIILLIAIVLGAVTGFAISNIFFDGSKKEKVFTAKGMSITLNESFYEVDQDEYDVQYKYAAVYKSRDVTVLAADNGFPDGQNYRLMTEEQYARIISELSEVECSAVEKKDGLVYFTHKYTDENTSKVYLYYDFVFKTDSSFWIVQIATAEGKADKYKDRIMTWAKSVTFDS